MGIEHETIRPDPAQERFAAKTTVERVHELLVYSGWTRDYENEPVGMLMLIRMLTTEVVSLRFALDELRADFDAYREAVASEMIDHGWAGRS